MSHLLVVEDHEHGRYMLEILLRGHGHTVDSAPNGEVALELARGRPPELVISDILMPVMDGFTLCRQWKSDERLREIPFVFYTATYTDPKDEEFALSLGADRFLVKPGEPEAFLAALDEVIAARREGRLPARQPAKRGEEVHFKSYNERLIRKLEDKMLQLEQIKVELEREVLERRLGEKAERRSRLVAEAVAAASVQALESREMGEMDHRIIDLAMQLVNAESGVMLEEVVSGRGQIVQVLATSGEIWPFEAGGVLGAGEQEDPEAERYSPLHACENLLLGALRRGASLMTNQPREHPDWTGRDAADGLRPESFLSVPLTLAHQVFGLIAVANRPGGFTARERGALETFANTAALARRVARSEEARRQVEEQLLQSQKMEAIGRLAGGVAHDFNNLLCGILGYTDLLLQRVVQASPLREDLEQVHAAAERAAVLTRQLLAFSRRQILQPEDLDLNEHLLELIKLMSRIIGEDVELELSPGRELWTVRADPGQIEQAIMNLVVNARDAMPDGGRVVFETENVDLDAEYCRSHVWAKPGRYVQVCVSDIGCGMDAETLNRIFEPFFTTKEAGKGTGLGLSMVYGIISQHGGMIHAYSEPGLGSTFKLYLPAVEPREEELPRGSSRAAPPRGSETILVAEDEGLVRDLALRVLEGAGYTVLEAANGREAIEVFERHAEEIDLALIDVIMPVLSGKAVLERIREICPQQRVLFSSGYAGSVVHAAFISEEGVELIQKPYRIEALLWKVRAVLDAPPPSAPEP